MGISISLVCEGSGCNKVGNFYCMKMKVLIILCVFAGMSLAHHTPEHRTIDEEPQEEQDTIPAETEDSENVASRHHVHQASNQAQGIPVLIPYPALRSPPAYYHQPIQYVPIFHEYPSARQGVGGGLQANLGPLSGGFGAGVGAGGLGGGLKFGLGGLGGFSANAGITPSVVVSNNPGYTRYYTKYYTPDRFYTGNVQPNKVYTVQKTTTPTNYPVEQIAASSPAVTTPYARVEPQGVLIPMYY